MITMKVTSNISFSKLANNLNSIINKTLNNTAKDSAEFSKSNIDRRIDIKGSPLVKLDKTTLNIREQGFYWEMKYKDTQEGKSKVSKPIKIKKGLQNKGGDTPLKYTNTLYNSIKAKKNVLTMEGYGGLHNEGYSVTGYSKTVGIPKREFIGTMISKDTEDKFFKDLEKNLKI